MRCGSLVLSLLLLLASECRGQAFTIGAGALATAGAIVAAGTIGTLAAAAFAGRRRGGGRRFRGGRRGGRGRRATSDAEEAEEVEEQSAIWGSVAAADNSGCALKLICLLEAAAGEADDDEQTVLNFIGDLEGTDKTVVASKLPYEAAGWMGKFRGAGACEVVYGTHCPYSKTDMMQLVSSVWSTMTAQEANSNVVSA